VERGFKKRSNQVMQKEGFMRKLLHLLTLLLLFGCLGGVKAAGVSVSAAAPRLVVFEGFYSTS
jgi:hypothetical protein